MGRLMLKDLMIMDLRFFVKAMNKIQSDVIDTQGEERPHFTTTVPGTRPRYSAIGWAAP